MPMPPPMHNVARPFFASRRCISCSSVTRTRAPEAPIGWPRAMAPPFTLTLAGSQPRSLLTAQAWAGERFVGLDKVQIVDGPAGFLQSEAARRDRARAHDRRIYPGCCP